MLLGVAEGEDEGLLLGDADGLTLGLADGLDDGLLLGIAEGEGEGIPLGPALGASDFPLLLLEPAAAAMSELLGMASAPRRSERL